MTQILMPIPKYGMNLTKSAAIGMGMIYELLNIMICLQVKGLNND